MRRFLRNSYLTRISFVLAAVLLLCAANSLAQNPPLVYTVENTGASFPAVTLPDFAHAPINRQLPDPFVFFSNGMRDARWSSEEQHRNEWMSAIMQTEQGPKPSCTGNPANDSVLGVTYTCSVAASYTLTSANHYTLTVTVTVVGPGGVTNTLSLPAAIVLPTAVNNNSANTVCPTSQWVAVRDWYGIGYRELASLRVQHIGYITGWSYSYTNRLCRYRRIQPE